MNIVLFEQEEVSIDDSNDVNVTVSSKDRRAMHMKTVLKVETGDMIRTGIVGDRMFDAEVTVLDDGSYHLKMLTSKQRVQAQNADEDISIILACPRPKALGRLYPVFSQQGVKSVAICNAARVEKPYWGSHMIKPDHYRPLLIKGLEQASVSTRLPQVTVDSRSFETFCTRLDKEFPTDRFVRLLAHPKENCHLSDYLANRLAESSHQLQVVVAIGPEGGWLDFEIDSLVNDHGFTCVSFSPRVLTTDVALTSVVGLISDVMRNAREKRGDGPV